MTVFRSLATSVLLATLVFSSFAFAAGDAPEAAANECEGSTAEIHECIGAKLAIANQELNTVYQALRTRLQSQQKSADADERKDADEIETRLVKAQRAWITFRDADCDLEGTQMLNGTGEGPIIHGCRMRHTEERVKFLKNLQ